MNRLNRKVEYALMALKVMADKRPGELTSAKEVVDLTGSPFDATARVLQQMAQREILRSEQGAYGGYLLIRDLNRVSILELMELILGNLAVAKCVGADGDCDLKTSCNIVSPITTLNRRLLDFYSTLMIGDLLKLSKKVVSEPEATA